MLLLGSACAPGWAQTLSPEPLSVVTGVPDWQLDLAAKPCEPAAAICPPDCLDPPCDYCYSLGGQARGYYINDQRIEFTGQEATFAVEAVADGTLHHQVGEWDVQLSGELFFTQPFDRNLLVDSPTRAAFAHNFDIDILSISQLYFAARRNDLYFAAGRFVTPFGRFYYPLYRNNFDDSPFIRSEAILYRETGMLAQWDPGNLVFTAALTNGGPNQDTNSSKAFIGRAGYDSGSFALGSSLKFQDGIGSEGQKTFNSHLGIDAMARRGNWTFSGEVIYDHYGFRRPGFDPDNITWGRSIYFRDLNKATGKPIQGVGYYLNLGYEGPLWTLMFNYGEFHPERLGIPEHDVTSRRGILKASRHWSPHLETYTVLMLENTLPGIFDTHDRKGVYFIAGCQFVF
ncbi:MAG: hypothetical protein SFU86_25030 [Pirellulaceae bacterium]|nr:hypothetical protein [Pirellulaceae bacterium]